MPWPVATYSPLRPGTAPISGRLSGVAGRIPAKVAVDDPGRQSAKYGVVRSRIVAK